MVRNWLKESLNFSKIAMEHLQQDGKIQMKLWYSHTHSNCLLPDITTVERTQRDGKKEKTECPVAIADYNKIMGGVELSDQKVSPYDFDRKSTKWWKKVFYEVFMTAVVNAYILFQESKQGKIHLLQFIVPLAEAMMMKGKCNCKEEKNW
ncbi:piggyBac transposable element-derived protein 4 [Trichonephila inaurata madagascariensis]|uniref:PiggyBac transposable element-derived protein 4 n=1 Tax=Trichonephila inaurata madagascariensis TaxID=2747483 RepID=A0A8X6XMV6_9ARAC|nr:piggyBac transposable element-derived protein 4 [Trichonephila inaurata madagascariensis]